MQYIGEIFVFVGLNSWSPIVQKVWLMPQNIVHLRYCLHCRIDWLEHLKLLPICHLEFYNAKSCPVLNRHFGFCVPCTVLHMELVALISMSCDRIVASNFRSCNAVLPYV